MSQAHDVSLINLILVVFKISFTYYSLHAKIDKNNGVGLNEEIKNIWDFDSVGLCTWCM